MESAFDRPRPFSGALRWVACTAVAVALVLLGWSLAPSGGTRVSAGRTATTVPERHGDKEMAPVPLGERDLLPPNPFSQPEEPGDRTSPPDSSSQWCTQPANERLGPAEDSWETVQLKMNDATYTLRHPRGWLVHREDGDVYRVGPPDAVTAIFVAFDHAGSTTADDVIAQGDELFSMVLPHVDIERSERATVAGVAGCRILGTEPVDGEQLDVEYLWTIVGNDVVVANLYTEASLPAGDKEVARRVLNSLSHVTEA
ncbi:MAG TPA: hypothetical protein VNA57_00980 [Acidimicrobiales bacterium]|nr:hypothetical protein [Acidimicrobiales bacterium]